MIGLRTALLAYAALAVVAGLTLRGKLLALALIVLAGVAVKTLLHSIRMRRSD